MFLKHQPLPGERLLIVLASSLLLVTGCSSLQLGDAASPGPVTVARPSSSLEAANSMADHEAEIAATEQALNNYEQTILSAMREVEDALAQLMEAYVSNQANPLADMS